jgi:hypothetical protein
MAQADQTVQNATFPTVRADINNNLAALFSANSGATAPTVTVAFQDWIDTSGANPLWKKRNAANNAWITLGTITGSAIAFEGTLIGGGGGGEGNRSSGAPRSGVSGGSGGYGVGILTVTPGTTYTVTVGAGGVGGAGGSDADGTAGGTSTFETISATGGAGGAFGGAASGSCSSADATLRRSTASLATPFLINGTATTREWENGTAAVAWAITSVLSPGALGEGGGIVFNNTAIAGGGGVGGAVLLLY